MRLVSLVCRSSTPDDRLWTGDTGARDAVTRQHETTADEKLDTNQPSSLLSQPSALRTLRKRTSSSGWRRDTTSGGDPPPAGTATGSERAACSGWRDWRNSRRQRRAVRHGSVTGRHSVTPCHSVTPRPSTADRRGGTRNYRRPGSAAVICGQRPEITTGLRCKYDNVGSDGRHC